MDLAERLLDLLQKEWVAVSGAPFAFALMGLIVFGLAYKASSWKHGAIIENLKSSSEVLRERLTAKEEQLGQYREKALGTASNEGAEVVRLSDADLSERALNLIAEVRPWLQGRERQDSELQQQLWIAQSNAATDDERHRLFNLNTQQLLRGGRALMDEFDSKFKGRIFALRDELVSRKCESRLDEFRYEHPTNPIGVRSIIDDIERMARGLMLPQ